MAVMTPEEQALLDMQMKEAQQQREQQRQQEQALIQAQDLEQKKQQQARQAKTQLQVLQEKYGAQNVRDIGNGRFSVKTASGYQTVGSGVTSELPSNRVLRREMGNGRVSVYDTTTGTYRTEGAPGVTSQAPVSQPLSGLTRSQIENIYGGRERIPERAAIGVEAAKQAEMREQISRQIQESSQRITGVSAFKESEKKSIEGRQYLGSIEKQYGQKLEQLDLNKLSQSQINKLEGYGYVKTTPGQQIEQYVKERMDTSKLFPSSDIYNPVKAGARELTTMQQERYIKNLGASLGYHPSKPGSKAYEKETSDAYKRISQAGTYATMGAVLSSSELFAKSAELESKYIGRSLGFKPDIETTKRELAVGVSDRLNAYAKKQISLARTAWESPISYAIPMGAGLKVLGAGAKIGAAKVIARAAKPGASAITKSSAKLISSLEKPAITIGKAPISRGGLIVGAALSAPVAADIASSKDVYEASGKAAAYTAMTPGFMAGARLPGAIYSRIPRPPVGVPLYRAMFGYPDGANIRTPAPSIIPKIAPMKGYGSITGIPKNVPLYRAMFGFQKGQSLKTPAPELSLIPKIPTRLKGIGSLTGVPRNVPMYRAMFGYQPGQSLRTPAPRIGPMPRIQPRGGYYKAMFGTPKSGVTVKSELRAVGNIPVMNRPTGFEIINPRYSRILTLTEKELVQSRLKAAREKAAKGDPFAKESIKKYEKQLAEIESAEKAGKAPEITTMTSITSMPLETVKVKQTKLKPGESLTSAGKGQVQIVKTIQVSKQVQKPVSVYKQVEKQIHKTQQIMRPVQAVKQVNRQVPLYKQAEKQAQKTIQVQRQIQKQKQRQIPVLMPIQQQKQRQRLVTPQMYKQAQKQEQKQIVAVVQMRKQLAKQRSAQLSKSVYMQLQAPRIAQISAQSAIQTSSQASKQITRQITETAQRLKTTEIVIPKIPVPFAFPDITKQVRIKRKVKRTFRPYVEVAGIATPKQLIGGVSPNKFLNKLRKQLSSPKKRTVRKTKKKSRR